MKLLKLGILICGGVGIAGFVVEGIGAMLETQQTWTILMLAVFGVATLMGLIAIAKPLFQAWQAGVALACFALAVWKMRPWETYSIFQQLQTGYQMMTAGAVLGALISLVAVLKPDETH